MSFALFRLHLRRALPAPLTAAVLVVALLLWLSRRAADPVRAAEAAAQLARGAWRAELCLALLALLAPILLAIAAGDLPRLARRERHWLLPRRLSRSAISLSSWGGTCAGALLWLALVGLACELGAGRAEASLREGHELVLAELEHFGPGKDLRWRSPCPDRPPGSVVQLSLGLFGDYGGVDHLELSSHVARGAEAFATARAAPGLRAVLEVPLPPDGDAPWLEFRARGSVGSLALHDTRLLLLEPAPERSGSLRFLAQAALTLGAVLALALGLGAWLSPASALLLLLGGYGLAWLEADALAGSWLARWLPGFELPRALGLLGQGRVPGGLPPESWGGAVLLVLLGLGLHRWALGRWRPGA